jgi:hypothetical protein
MSTETERTKKEKALHIGGVSSSGCLHNWKHGYTLEPVVFCTKCNKDADEVYKGMTYNEQRRLVVD